MAPRRSRPVVVAQWLLAAAVIGFAVREVARQWREVGPAIAGLRPAWSLVLASGAIVLLTYLALVEAWRATLRAWGETLPFTTATRIWFVSNLGKYVPGKVWQIAAMGALAQRAGVAPAAAVGSSLIVNLVNLVTGFAIIALTGAGNVAAVVGVTGADSRVAETVVVAIAVLGGLALVFAPLAVPTLAGLAARMSGRATALPTVPHRAIWLAAATTAAAWLMYGVAFAIFARGISDRATGNATSYIAVYTGSYLAGYLAFFAPGGLGVREAVLVLAMPRFGLMTAADAAVIAVASRLWLTILEIVPGVALWRPAMFRPDSPERSA